MLLDFAAAFLCLFLFFLAMYLSIVFACHCFLQSFSNESMFFAIGDLCIINSYKVFLLAAHASKYFSTTLLVTYLVSDLFVLLLSIFKWFTLFCSNCCIREHNRMHYS